MPGESKGQSPGAGKVLTFSVTESEAGREEAGVGTEGPGGHGRNWIYCRGSGDP